MHSPRSPRTQRCSRGYVKPLTSWADIHVLCVCVCVHTHKMLCTSITHPLIPSHLVPLHSHQIWRGRRRTSTPRHKSTLRHTYRSQHHRLAQATRDLEKRPTSSKRGLEKRPTIPHIPLTTPPTRASFHTHTTCGW